MNSGHQAINLATIIDHLRMKSKYKHKSKDKAHMKKNEEELKVGMNSSNGGVELENAIEPKHWPNLKAGLSSRWDPSSTTILPNWVLSEIL